MDPNYYQNNLQYLYESSDPSKPPVYNVDPLLFTYTKKDTFTNNLLPASFFRTISSVGLRHEDIQEVMNRAGAEDVNIMPAIPNTSIFSESPVENEVFMNVARGNAMPSQIVQLMANEIAQTQSATLSSVDDITKSHVAFDNYMRGIIVSICSPCMKVGMTNVSPLTNITTPIPINLDNAAKIIGVDTDTRRKDMIFQVVSNLGRSTLLKLIDSRGQFRTDVMSNLNNASGSFTRPLYYQLRSDMIEGLVIPTDVIPDQEDFVLLYIKRILVDTYIKTCYPLIHYDFIDAMMRKYAKNGDFVNVRIALLAKVYFAYYFVDYIRENIFLTDAGLSAAVKTQYTSVFNSIYTNLNNYMTALNNININGTPGVNEMAEIIKSLQQLSVSVVTQSRDMVSVKTSIDDNQLALRNILANTEIMNRSYAKSNFEFWATLSVLFAFIVVCSVLLMFELPEYALLTAGAVFVIVIIIKLVQFLKKFLSNN